MSYFPHHPFLIFMKLFAFNSAKTPEKSSIIFIIYNCILVSLYIIILYFQIKELYGRKLHEMNLIVLHIQIVALVFAFFATIITNLWYSKKYIKCLKNLSRFDNSLSKLGFFINNKKITRIFYVTFCLWLIIFLYVSFTEYYYSVFLKPYMTWIYWCSYYLPLGLTHFASYFLIMSLYFLLIRYSLLTKILKNNYKHPDVIRFFVKVYFDIIEITNEMVPQFSLQICALFSIAAITVTNNSFLIVKGNYSFWQYLILVNVLLMHIIEIVLVVWAHYRIHQEIDNINFFAARITSRTDVERFGSEWSRNYFLIDRIKLDIQVFGMFSVTPTTLLNVTAWVVSYLIIMIQFAPQKIPANQKNWPLHAPTY